MARYDNLVRGVKKVFGLGSDNNTTSTPQPTTPTTTQQNIQTETLSGGQSSFVDNKKNNTLDLKNISFTNPNPNENVFGPRPIGFDASKESDNFSPAPEKKSWLSNISDTFNNIRSKTKNMGREAYIEGVIGINEGVNILGQKYASDKLEKNLNVGYNENNHNVIQLKIKEGLQDRFNTEYENYVNIMKDSSLDQATKDMAEKQFYDSTKNMFYTNEDDFYMDGYDIFSIGRRKNQFTDEELAALKSNNITKGSDSYVPSQKVFKDFVNLYGDNIDTQSYLSETIDNNSIKHKINQLRGIKELDTKGYELDEDGLTNQQRVRKEWIDNISAPANEYMRTKISNGDAISSNLNKIERVVETMASRVASITDRIFTQERAILAKPESERTDADKELLRQAGLVRKFEHQYGANIAGFIMKHIDEYTDENGYITDSLRNGLYEGLNYGLNDIVREGGGTSDVDKAIDEVKMRISDVAKGGLSPLDRLSMLVDDAEYNYKRSDSGKVRKTWAWLQKYGGDTAGFALQEALQFVVGGVGRVYTLGDLAVSSIYNLATEGELKSGAMNRFITNYQDQDFSMGLFLSNTGGVGSRTFEKYMLLATEYAGETLGMIGEIYAGEGLLNLGGKLLKIGKIKLLGAASEWAGAQKILRTGTSAIKKAYNALDKMQDGSKFIKGTKQTLDAVINFADDVKIETMAKIAKKAGHDLLLDQMIDAGMSQYDTERYSDNSMLFSLGGTAMFEALPILWKSDLLGLAGNMLSSRVGKGGIWDVADLVKNNEGFSKMLEQNLGKKYSDLSLEQIRTISSDMANIIKGTEAAFNIMSKEGKEQATKWGKDVMYRYLNQALSGNSAEARQISSLVSNNMTNPADMLKYITRDNGVVKFGPWTSSIELKNGTKGYMTWGTTEDAKTKARVFDSMGTAGYTAIKDGFTDTSLQQLKNAGNGLFDELVADSEHKYFKQVGDRKILTEEGYKKLGMDVRNQSLDSLGVELASQENTREIFRDKLKSIVGKGKNIQDETIDLVADSGAYDEVVDKIIDVIC